MELQFEQVTKNYKDKKVLKGISLTMRTRVYGLLGPNGAGKTTMIRILADVLRPGKGQVLCDGRDIHAMGDEYRAKIGYLPQDVSFYGDFTGKDYLEYSAALKGMEKSMAGKRIEELAYVVGLQNDLARKCAAYSGGMQRRLGIAQALLDNPEILILDDSASALDFATDAALRRAIRNASEDMTVFIVSQRAASIMYADKILVLDDGKIVGQGTHQELLKSCEVYQEIYYSQFEKEESHIGQE